MPRWLSRQARSLTATLSRRSRDAAREGRGAQRCDAGASVVARARWAAA